MNSLSTPPKCCRPGCEVLGAWQPVLILIGHGVERIQDELILGLAVCNDHKEGATVESFIPDEKTWGVLADTFQNYRGLKPVKPLTRIRWQSFETASAYAERIARMSGHGSRRGMLN